MSGQTQLIALVLLVASSAVVHAQTLSLVVDVNGARTRSLDIVTGEMFDVVTLVNTGGSELSAAEWWQTDLNRLAPGVFWVNKWLICPVCNLLQENLEENLVFGLCLPPSEGLELMRVTYGNFTGDVSSDLVVSTRGFRPGDGQPSSFEGSPGFVDCDENKFPLDVAGGEPWITGAGVIVPEGAVVFNPTPPLVVGAATGTMSLIKATYR